MNRRKIRSQGVLAKKKKILKFFKAALENSSQDTIPLQKQKLQQLSRNKS